MGEWNVVSFFHIVAERDTNQFRPHRILRCRFRIDTEFMRTGDFSNDFRKFIERFHQFILLAMFLCASMLRQKFFYQRC